MVHVVPSLTGTPRLTVRFFSKSTGGEPVRDWLKRLPVEERREIGTDIKTVKLRRL